MRLTQAQAKAKYAANRKRYAAKGYISRSVRMAMRSGPQTFTQVCLTRWTYLLGQPSGSSPNLQAFAFTLQDVIDYSQWTSVFDQYRFKKITMIIQGNTINLGTSAALEPLFTCIDYDDAVTPVSVQAVMNYGNAMVHHAQCNDKRTFIPATNTAVQLTGGSYTGGSTGKNRWIDCSNTDVAHYGIKIAIPTSTTTNVNGWNVVFQYVIEFKNNR